MLTGVILLVALIAMGVCVVLFVYGLYLYLAAYALFLALVIYGLYRWALQPDIPHAEWERQRAESVGVGEERSFEDVYPNGYPKKEPRDEAATKATTQR